MENLPQTEEEDAFLRRKIREELPHSKPSGHLCPAGRISRRRIMDQNNPDHEVKEIANTSMLSRFAMERASQISSSPTGRG
jgi:hypothetical protein